MEERQMKKIGLVLTSVLVVFICSSCSLKLTIDTNSKTEKAEVVDTTKSTGSTEKSNEEITNTNLSNIEEAHAFYGVWCSGSKNRSDAEKIAMDLSDKGYKPQIIVTTDWENLNPEKFYVVTAGVCETKQEAELLLSDVKKSGYSDAYIKYTGKRK